MPQADRHLRAVADDGGDRADHLLGLVATGDREAYAALFDLVAPTVLGLCRRVLRDPALAEEVAQEVLLEVWRKAPSRGGDGRSARGWIALVAHRRAVDRVRSEQAERDRRSGPGDPPRPGVDPVADLVADREEGARVRHALAALTPLQRQSVELAYFDGHTYREVAAVLDIPLGTVKTRIRDGLIRLRDTLGSEP